MSDIGVDWESRVDWAELRKARIDKLKKQMAASDIGGVLVQRFDNMKYLTSFRPFVSLIYYPQYAAFVPIEGEVCLLTEAGDFDQYTKGMPWIHDLRIWPYDLNQAVGTLGDLIQEHGLEKAAIAYDDVVSPSIIGALQSEFPSARFVDGILLINEAKAVKHPEEVKVIREALEIVEVGIDAGRHAIREGIKESEVAAEMARAVIRAGCDALLTFPQVSSDPHRRMASDKRIRNGDLVLLDMNIGYNGYVGDLARTVSGALQARTKREILGYSLTA
jgi:Xaa-Pro aminopeptidase